MESFNMNLYKSFFKRVIDIAASGCVLVVLTLPLAVVTRGLHLRQWPMNAAGTANFCQTCAD